MTKSGTGTLTLTENGGDNFSGGIVVNNGTLVLDNANSAIAGGTTIGASGTVQIGNNDGNGNLPAGSVDDEGALIFNRANNVLVATGIPGGGTLTQSGSGTLTLSVSSSYTGNTTVSAGTLALTNSGAISGSAQVNVGAATLDVSGVTAASGVTTLQTLNLANASLNVSAGYLQTNLDVTALNMGGAGNTINVGSLPPIAYYPATVALLKSGSAINGYNFALGSVPAGYTGASIAQSGDQTAVLLTLTGGPVGVWPYVTWVGTDALGNVNTNWSDAVNWQSPGAPAAADNVIFNDTAAQSASAYSTPGGGAAALVPANVNNIVNANFSVSSLTYTNVNNGYQNTFITNGVTLTVTNSLVIGSSSSDFGDAAKEYVTVSGANGTLTVNNTNSTLFVGLESAAGSGAQAALDMSGLGTFNATVNTFAIGAIASTAPYPSGIAYLAQTNFITAINNTTNNESGSTETVAFMVGETGKASALKSYLYLGQQNAINASYIGVGICKQNGEMDFNPTWVNPAVTIRGNNGVSPVTAWAIGDGLGQTGTSTAPAGTVDFTGGAVNALVTTMYLGRSPNASGSRAATGTLTFGAGTISVGTIYDGYQAYTNTDYGAGTINVNGTGLLQVGILNLAATAGSTGTATTTGTLNIANGTVQVGTIATGAGQSAISLASGTLVVTNDVGSPAAPLTTLTLSGDNTLQLNADASGNLTNIVVATVSASGTTTINIASVLNPTPSATTQTPLISYTGTDPIGSLTLGTVPAGYTSPSLVDDTAKQTIDLRITAPSVILPTTSPVITSMSLAGTNIVVSGTNGQPGRTYYLLASTNVAQPFNNWVVVATNVLEAANFTFIGTNVVPSNVPQRFYILSSTNN